MPETSGSVHCPKGWRAEGWGAGAGDCMNIETRNVECKRELMRVFRDVELVEQLGSGMHRMLGAYGPDIFRYTDTFFHVVLHFQEDKTIAPLKDPIQELPAHRDREEKPADWPPDWPWSESWSESWPKSWVKTFPPTLANRLLVVLHASPKGTKTLLPLLGLSTPGHSLRLAMATLLAGGLIERTLPDKPNSRFQQYRLTARGRAALAGRTVSTSINTEIIDDS